MRFVSFMMRVVAITIEIIIEEANFTISTNLVVDHSKFDVHSSTIVVSLGVILKSAITYHNESSSIHQSNTCTVTVSHCDIGQCQVFTVMKPHS